MNPFALWTGAATCFIICLLFAVIDKTVAPSFGTAALVLAWCGTAAFVYNKKKGSS